MADVEGAAVAVSAVADTDGVLDVLGLFVARADDERVPDTLSESEGDPELQALSKAVAEALSEPKGLSDALGDPVAESEGDPELQALSKAVAEALSEPKGLSDALGDPEPQALSKGVAEAPSEPDGERVPDTLSEP